MRTESIQYKIYEFNELSPKVQEKVLDDMREINIFDEWHDGTLEYFVEELDKVGFEDAKIQYSGFWSQGDGASFDSKCNVEKLVNALGDWKYKKLIKFYRAGQFGLTIERNSYASHYSHERTRNTVMEIYFFVDTHKKLLNLCEEFRSAVEELRRKWSNKIYKGLEDGYNDLTSDESIKEAIEANQFEFLESGKKY